APKAAKAKIDAPAPGLTERERWLLDRVEQLERRVTELEAKKDASGAPAENAAAAPTGATTPSVNVAGNAAASSTEAAVNAGAVAAPAAVAANGGAASGVPSAALSPAAPHAQEKTAAKPAKAEPFAFADFTWLNGNARTKDTPYATSFFTPEIRADVDYNYSFNHPKDDTIGGSSEVFRSNEVHVTQLGVGGDFHYDNVRARLMTQFGLYSQTTPRNDASPSRGQWNLDN